MFHGQECVCSFFLISFGDLHAWGAADMEKSVLMFFARSSRGLLFAVRLSHTAV